MYHHIEEEMNKKRSKALVTDEVDENTTSTTLVKPAPGAACCSTLKSPSITMHGAFKRHKCIQDFDCGFVNSKLKI